jgi:hypothetical protein
MIRISTLILNGVLFCVVIFASAFAQAPQLQREIDTIPVMISGVPLVNPFADGLLNSNPTFTDIDNDGDFDLFIGAFQGNINFFRNTGTASNHIFVFVTKDFVSNAGALSDPTFSDIDNDGDFDLFVGDNSGEIKFYRNQGSPSNPSFALETRNFASIVGVSPTFVDIDKDNDFDLFAISDGKINFYRNTGTASSPSFVLETGSIGSIKIGTPSFADIDNDGDFDLFVGEFDGSINFYRNTGTASNPMFTLETENFASIDVGSSSIPAFADIDKDGDFDLIVGEHNGSTYFYRNTGTASSPSFALETSNFTSIIDVGYVSAPTFIDVDNDGDFDLLLGADTGKINFFRNTGTASNPIFTLETENLASIDVGSASIPAFADIDKDGDFDLFVGEDSNSGNVNFYRNTGTALNPVFALETENFVSNVGFETAPTFVDIDDDSDFDLFVGETAGNINFYRNTGTASNPVFALETENFSSIDVGFDSTPTFVDIDEDGDFDLFVGVGGGTFAGGGNIYFYRNTGTASNPIFVLETRNLASIDVGHQSKPIFVDIDNDGDFDLFVGEYHGGLHFYRNVTPTSVRSRETEGFPNTFMLNQNYPNPFNPETTIQYQLPKTRHVKLIVYNLVGHQVATLVNKKQQAGFYSVDWDGKDDLGRIVASGVYLYRLESKEFVKVRKLTLIR